MPQFVPTVPRREMAVDAIVTVHYFEYAKTMSLKEKNTIFGNCSTWTRARSK